MRVTEVARPVCSSASTTMPFSRGLPVAGSNFDGMPLRNRASDGSRLTGGLEISFPFDPGTALEPGQAHTIIGLDLQEEMARAADTQGNRNTFRFPLPAGG